MADDGQLNVNFDGSIIPTMETNRAKFSVGEKGRIKTLIIFAVSFVPVPLFDG